MTPVSIRAWVPLTNSAGELMRMKSGLRVRTYRLPAESSLAGRRIFFISDLHIQSDVISVLPDRFRIRCPDWYLNAFQELFSVLGIPEYVIFGGDLCTHLSVIESGRKILQSIPEQAVRLAVPGNWEQRRSWLIEKWESFFNSCGFRYLCNNSFCDSAIHFYGLDDFKNGLPKYIPGNTSGNELFQCLLAHNPDAVPAALSGEQLKRFSLILCGHTHGGQIRIPHYGAVMTSSVFGRRFGGIHYRNKITGTDMLISWGIGTTRVPVRLFCPPEILQIIFTAKE